MVGARMRAINLNWLINCDVLEVWHWERLSKVREINWSKEQWKQFQITSNYPSKTEYTKRSYDYAGHSCFINTTKFIADSVLFLTNQSVCMIAFITQSIVVKRSALLEKRGVVVRISYRSNLSDKHDKESHRTRKRPEGRRGKSQELREKC